MLRRRLALILLAAGVLLFMRYGVRRPVDVTFDLSYGDVAPKLRSVTLILSRDGHIARDLHLGYPTGAPPHEHWRTRLLPGDYEVATRLEVEGAPERHPSRTVHVGEAGTYPLDLTQ